MARTTPAYAELHSHSAYSFLDATAQPWDLVERADRLGLHALALTDHDNLCAALPFAQHAAAIGLRSITGCELTVRDEHGAFHLVLLAETREGYAHLCRLITLAHRATRDVRGTRVTEPAAAFDAVLAHAGGLTCLTGCPTFGALATDTTSVARRRRDLLLEAFGDHLAVEVQRDFRRGSEARLRAAHALARERGLPLVATNDVHIPLRRHGPLQDTLVAIRHGRPLDACTSERRGNREHVLKGPAEMVHLFADLPEAIRETVAIAERCSFDPREPLGYRPPGTDARADVELRAICEARLADRYPTGHRWATEARERLASELSLIARHGLASFFLLHVSILDLAREAAAAVRGRAAARHVLPPGRGRGSSVGSIVCYLTGLSHVDPLEAGLSLGRFLNERLDVVPDIDLDFPRDIREALIARIHAVYGDDRSALVGAFSTYRARSAIREVGRALGLPAGDIARLAAISEGLGADRVAEDLRSLPELRHRADAPRLRLLATLCRQIDGLPRHLGQHPGGMVVADHPLSDLVPLQPAATAGRTICQWDKDACGDAGLLKIDLLGLGMLSAVEHCVEEIDRVHGERIDLSRIPLDDPAVYEEIQAADTVGVFQIESRAQMQTLLRTQPTCLEDLVVEVALVRPGPIQGGAVHPYLSRRAARRADPSIPIPYDHPLLEGPLRETLGVIIFQDQVLEVAEALAGFTPGEAEALRRAMSRRRSRDAIERQRVAFVTGARTRGVTAEVAERVFERILAFSAFGFPKAHAAAFALLAYQSAWLRRHHPAAFLCALLESQPMGFYPPATLLRDAERRGVVIRPIDINRSRVATHLESDDGVRLGLRHVIGLGEEMAERIVLEREARGPFGGIRECARRLELPAATLRRVIAAGACDAFGERRRLIWEAGLVPAPRTPGQLRLDLEVGRVPEGIPRAEEWELLLTDYAATGTTLRTHPIAHLRRDLPNCASSRDLLELPHGSEVRVPGLVVTRQRPASANGVVFLLLEDEYGFANLILRPEVYERHRALVRGAPLLLATGTLERRDRRCTIVVERIARLIAPGSTVLADGDVADLEAVAPPVQHFAQGRVRSGRG